MMLIKQLKSQHSQGTVSECVKICKSSMIYLCSLLLSISSDDCEYILRFPSKHSVDSNRKKDAVRVICHRVNIFEFVMEQS